MSAPAPRAIVNPVLPGFHPDPSIVRVGSDYYLATSTFEWTPAVRLHHSRDLVHWRSLGGALDGADLPPLRGVPDSGGVWAPSLSHHDGRFWLVYSVVRHVGSPYKDVDNYLVTAEAPTGPWSEPAHLNSSGFDASLFHDEDGRHWLVNVEWDHRPDRPSFAGIVLQEYDPGERRLTGPVTTIARKDRLIEGPNLYRRDGWYYLMLAEGGTGWEHGISMARAREIAGPYAFDPVPDVLTSRGRPELPLQKAGHGELVATPEGEWYLAHLASRPVASPTGEPRCVLGRETCLQRVVWRDGWLRLADGTTEAALTTPAPGAAAPAPPAPDGPAPRSVARRPRRGGPGEDGGPWRSPEWSALRRPIDDSWASLTERPGWLRLFGGQSPHSLFDQSLLARRVTDTRQSLTVGMEFHPTRFSQAAGLIAWYDTSTYYYLRVSHDERRGRVLGLVLRDDGAYAEPPETVVECEDWPDEILLRARLDGASLWLEAAPEEGSWRRIGPELDATRLSDDYGSRLRFTGAFLGICAQDLGGTRAPADFRAPRFRAGAAGGDPVGRP
ncbi:family 43 glycosylhydrolase [Streptomyces sp. 3MP-14]|uniref:Family 43 glycosylhydrolase n=1 Tax=Streptomyces mimosae TaxID=2586635 RepID=A0A5N6A2K6_9ACTN|nr:MULTISPECIES: glycoside hydrolase family 43 protein [Streptomyces]KAB8161910.1 family 43 glycosylhydrolase [Streptomyces mimosae]KAB8173608.1 family 43 glycosylhydrolase [Streptomyces sp. 3MP-14]